MAVTEAYKEAIWLRRLYAEISKPDTIAQLIRIDNRSTMSLAKNPKHHDRAKHIAIRHHFIREPVENEMDILDYVQSEENTADILTKSLAR